MTEEIENLQFELMDDMIIEWLEKSGLDSRHYVAGSYNWDGECRALKWIIDKPDTDLGTALVIFWLSDPFYAFEKYKSTGKRDREEPRFRYWSQEAPYIISRNVRKGWYPNWKFKEREIETHMNLRGAEKVIAHFALPERALLIPENAIELEPAGYEEGLPYHLVEEYDRRYMELEEKL